MRFMVGLALPAFVLTSLALAADPPERINYQGVLRNSADEPLDGNFPMTFRLFDSLSGGNEILVDTHGAVTVSNGLFNVEIGSGSVADGSGPGTFSTLADVFGQHVDLYLEVEVNGETLAPRTPVAAAAYALNARRVRGVEIVSDGPLDIYVDGSTGDDSNDGLSLATAKKTIQAGVNAVPQILKGPATIRIGDGTYSESVFIDRRLMETVETFPNIILLGNETSPQNVVLDGQSTLTEGVLVLGMAEIRGIEVTGFLEEGFEVNSGGVMFVDHCRVIGNVNGPNPPWGGIGVFAATASIANTVIANNSNHGMEIGEGWFKVEVDNVEITGNASDGIHLYSSGNFEVGGRLLVQNNGGIGVLATSGAVADLGGRADLTIESNAGGSMQASYHGTIRGYGNGTVGSCVAVHTQSICEP